MTPFTDKSSRSLMPINYTKYKYQNTEDYGGPQKTLYLLSLNKLFLKRKNIMSKTKFYYVEALVKDGDHKEALAILPIGPSFNFTVLQNSISSFTMGQI